MSAVRPFWSSTMKDRLSKLSYLNLFLHTFYISAFAVGGGYVMIPMLKERFADKLGWIDENELTSIIALGQSAPGAMIINSAVIMGYKILGFGGAVSAALGTALPSVLMVAAIGLFYEFIRDNIYVSAVFRGMLAGVSAIIADTVINMAAPYFKRDKLLHICVMAAAFLADIFFDINVGFIIIACVLLGVVLSLVNKKRGEKQ